MVILSLFLFIGVEYSVCDENKLIFKEDNQIYDIDFFNLIFVDDKSRSLTCEYLSQANSIEIEKEPLAQNSYYIYVDDKLLHEIVIDQGWAKINLNYPEYLHQIKKNDEVISLNVNQYNKNNRSFYILTRLLFVFVGCLFIFMWMSKM